MLVVTSVRRGLAGDAMLNATRLYLSYLTAVDASNRDAPKVADAIATSSLRDYRIVAHSLGCRLIVDALPLLPPESRPSEIHLCAAALTANHALPKLDSICRPGGRIHHYWSSHDEALSSAFLASRGEPALGSMPLPNEDKPLTISTSSHDVSSYLGLASHGTYRLHFDEFAADAILGRPPPPPLAPWLVRQQAALGREPNEGPQAAAKGVGLRHGLRAPFCRRVYEGPRVVARVAAAPKASLGVGRRW